VRDPKTTSQAWMGRITARWSSVSVPAAPDVLINLTTGRARVSCTIPTTEQGRPASTLRGPEERVRHVIELRPDICSLDMGSLNMGSRVFINTPDHLQTMAVAIRDAGRASRAGSVRDRPPPARQKNSSRLGM